jgi:SAM-dependent MidA family methyltransferase
MSLPSADEKAPLDLPVPDTAAMEQSHQLVEKIIARIEQNNNAITFDEYMQMALYEPGLGYYSGAAIKFGASGDFVTAPEVSSLFGYCLAHQIKGLLGQGCAPAILEFGAGSGKLCQQIMAAGPGLERYLILELSAELKQRQYEYLEQHLPADEFLKIEWLDALPESFDGVVLANEILDAMPVSLVEKSDGWWQLGVTCEKQRFNWRRLPTTDRLSGAIEKLESQLGQFPDGYTSEINLNLEPWFKGLSQSCHKVVALIIDYGYEQAEYYHSIRNRGTLICHYQHRAHYDPFVYPGLQDLTAFVDFDACADAACANGFEAIGLVSQNRFLLANDLLEEANRRIESSDATDAVEWSQQLKTLSLPQEMGEKFKVLALQKNLKLEMPAMLRGGAYG